MCCSFASHRCQKCSWVPRAACLNNQLGASSTLWCWVRGKGQWRGHWQSHQPAGTASGHSACALRTAPGSAHCLLVQLQSTHLRARCPLGSLPPTSENVFIQAWDANLSRFLLNTCKFVHFWSSLPTGQNLSLLQRSYKAPLQALPNPAATRGGGQWVQVWALPPASAEPSCCRRMN